MLEIEFKNMLTQNEYQRLMAHFKGNPKSQTNTYFDTPEDGLKQQKMALRVRKSSSGFELTLKEPHPQGKVETNQDLSEPEATRLLNLKGFPEGPVLKKLVSGGITPHELRIIGELTTERAQFPYKGGTLFLDYSTYGDKSDYELEYEADTYDAGLQTFEQLLRDFQLPSRPAESKIKRATS